MARNFYYGSDARVVGGSANFAAVLGASGESFGLSPEQIEGYQALDALLQEAYRAASTPETRTSVAVRAKDDAMRACQRAAAGLAVFLSSAGTASDAQLLSMGLQPRRKRAVWQPPETPPTVEVARVVGRVATLRIHAYGQGGTRMAAGAIAAYVYSHVGSEPPADSLQYDMHGIASRRTYEIVFPDNVPGGATAWVLAAWLSTRGRTSAACLPVRVTIQGGPVLAGSVG